MTLGRSDSAPTPACKAQESPRTQTSLVQRATTVWTTFAWTPSPFSVHFLLMFLECRLFQFGLRNLVYIRQPEFKIFSSDVNFSYYFAFNIQCTKKLYSISPGENFNRQTGSVVINQCIRKNLPFQYCQVRDDQASSWRLESNLFGLQKISCSPLFRETHGIWKVLNHGGVHLESVL